MKRRPKRLSKRGAEFLARWEGVRLEPYNDPAGHATIGVGHLLHLGRVTAGDRARYKGFTRRRALALLQKDAGVAAHHVNALVKVKLTQDQFDALVSFVFNVGGGAFQKSTLLRELNRGHYARVPHELMKWTKAGGREMSGLRQRRAAEGLLFQRRPPRQKPLRAAGRIGRTHFTWEEARSKPYPGEPGGKAVPLHLRPLAVTHARNLEKARTQINAVRAMRGMPPIGMRVLSWYRSPGKNAYVGGARASRHMKADATDFSKAELMRWAPWHGGRYFVEAVLDRVFREGGFGQYPGGNRHTDSRGWRARWSSWTR